MDIALFFDPKLGPDLGFDNNDLEIDPGLESAVLISLFSDRLVDQDEVPVGEKSRRGWWGDLVADSEGDQIGSRLWLLDRSKRTEKVRLLSEEYAYESLRWLIDDGIAKDVLVSSSWDAKGFLEIAISIEKPSGDQVNFKYSSVWEKQNGI